MILTKRFRVDGVLVDASAAVLSDINGAYGIRRQDNQSVIVTAGTALTKLSTGVYAYTFTPPVNGITYEYVVKFTYGAEHYYDDGLLVADTTSSDLVDVTNLLSRVKPYVVGGPTNALLNETIRHMAREFCRMSGVWQEKLSISTVTDQVTYDLQTSQYQAEVVNMLSLTTADDYPVGYTNIAEDGTTFDLVATRATGETLTAKVMLVPWETSSLLPQRILVKYGAAIAAGARAYLQGQERKPWTAPTEAGTNYAEFVRGISAAKLDKITGRGPVITRSAIPSLV